jgi:hypothetical protein
MIYGNYLIDNVYSQYPHYVTTIFYENPEPSVDILRGYFHRDLNLDITSNSSLGSYFTNPEDFVTSIEKRLKKLGQGGLHLI